MYCKMAGYFSVRKCRKKIKMYIIFMINLSLQEPAKGLIWPFISRILPPLSLYGYCDGSAESN